MSDADVRYSLSDLTEVTGVSARTVRYYIGEGLLPPPITAGPRTYYTAAHRDRLRLIARYKADYLPLREIRRELGRLSDEEVARLVGEEPVPEVRWHPPLEAAEEPSIAYSMEVPLPPISSPMPPRDSAVEYLSRVLPRRGRAAPESEFEPERWRRVPISDEVELMIREDVYQRHEEKVSSARRWLRRLFS